MPKLHNKNYEKKYFTKQFTAVGSFSKEDLKRSVNWFLCQLNFFEKHFKINFDDAKSILEVGCAIGGISHIFAGKKKKSFALDISKFSTDRAKKLSPEVKFFIYDIQKEILTKEKFDYIFAFEVLEHLENPQKGIINLKKRLSRGGKLIITTPYPYKKYINIETHINVLSPEKWIDFFKKAGFKKIKFQPVTFAPFLYRYHFKLGIVFPFNSNLPLINSTVFYVAE